MKNAIATFVAALLLVSGTVVGQDPTSTGRQVGRWGTQIGPEAPTPVEWTLNFGEQFTLAASNSGWRAWAAAHAGWTLLSDPRTGQPWRAFGPGISVTREAPTESDVRAATEALVRELAPTIGISPTAFRFTAAVQAGSIWYVDFGQFVGEARALDCGLGFRVHESGKLVMWGGRFVPDHALDDKASIPFAAARDTAKRFLSGMGYLTDETVLTPHTERLAVHVVEDRITREGRLVWEFSWHSARPDATWIVRVDAKDGSIVKWWNDDRMCALHGHGHKHGATCAHDAHDERPLATDTPSPLASILWFASFSGVTSGTVHDGVAPDQAPVARNFPYVRLNAGGATVTADAAGAYSYTGGAASITVTSGLDGAYITTNNSATGGAQAAFTGTATTGVLDVTWTDTISQLAERDAYFFGTKIRNYIKAMNPAEVLFDTPIVANINVTGNCNAFYSPSAQSINFYPPGGGCINTAYSGSVVEHEYGHHVTTRIYASHGFSVPGHLGEGFSDAQAAAVENNPVIGLGFQGVGTIIRNADNTCQYPTSCGTAIHARGQLIAACVWHTRVQFSNAFGAAGRTQLDQMLWRHLHGSPQSEPESLLDFLLQDDNNANLNDGTPNLMKFYQGFTVQHGVPFPIQGATITHLPVPNTYDQNAPVVVRATITASNGATVTGASLWRNVSGGAFTSSVMTNIGGNTWQGTIPVQAAGAKVAYYVTATTSVGLSATSPEGAPTAAYSYRTGRQIPIFSDDMEGVDPGWTTAATQGTSDWQWQAPGNAAHAYDPATAFNGTRVRGTDLSAAGFNGNYANNVNTTLTSPAINCTGKTGVTATFRRWLTVETSTYDFARVQSNVNGGAYTTLWTNPNTGDTLDTTWVEQSVDLGTTVNNQPDVRVRFNLQSDTSVTRGGWTIDAFRVDALLPTPPLASVASNIGGQTGTVRVSGLEGDQVFLIADIVASPTYYDGVGTMSINIASGSALLLVPGTVVLDASGIYDLVFPVPAAPGLTAYFQALLVPSANPAGRVVSNLLPFTIQ